MMIVCCKQPDDEQAFGRLARCAAQDVHAGGPKGWCEENPAQRFQRRTETPRERVLSNEEMAKLATAGSSPSASFALAGNAKMYDSFGDEGISRWTGKGFVRGNGGNDEIWSNGGADRLLGNKGNDAVLGGPGADRIDGGLGNHSLEGGGVNDVIMGNAGADRIFGDGGNGTIVAGIGRDVMAGGAGQTRLFSDPRPKRGSAQGATRFPISGTVSTGSTFGKLTPSPDLRATRPSSSLKTAPLRGGRASCVLTMVNSRAISTVTGWQTSR